MCSVVMLCYILCYVVTCECTEMAAAGVGGTGWLAGSVKCTAAEVEQGIWTVAVVGADVFFCYFVLLSCYVVPCAGTGLAAACVGVTGWFAECV
jgi:hypothetical protein